MSEYKRIPWHKLEAMTKKKIINEYDHALNIKDEETLEVLKQLKIEKTVNIELLVHSIPKEAVRELIGRYEGFDEHCYRCGDSRVNDFIEDLNKLLEGSPSGGDNNG